MMNLRSRRASSRNQPGVGQSMAAGGTAQARQMRNESLATLLSSTAKASRRGHAARPIPRGGVRTACP